MDEPIETWFILNWADLASSLKVHRKIQVKQPAKATPAWVWLVLIAVVALTTFLFSGKPRRPIAPVDPNQDLIVGLKIAGLVAAAIVVLLLWVRRAQRKSFEKLTDDHINQRWIIDDGGLLSRGPKTETNYLWEFFPKIIESTDAFLLYVTDHNYHVLPTRGFASAEPMNRFAALASEHAKEYVVVAPCRYPEKVPPAGLTDF